jgi:hypothetical protein
MVLYPAGPACVQAEEEKGENIGLQRNFEFLLLVLSNKWNK